MTESINGLLHEETGTALSRRDAGVERFLYKGRRRVLSGVNGKNGDLQLTVGRVVVSDIVHSGGFRLEPLDAGVQRSIVDRARVYGIAVVVKVVPSGSLQQFVESEISTDQFQSRKGHFIQVGA